jgi:hypothetical protein
MMARPEEQETTDMADIDFGTLIREVMVEMECARGQLTPEEARDGDIAGYRYQGAAARAIRMVFNEAEAKAEAATRCDAPEDPIEFVRSGADAALPVCPHCGMAMPAGSRYCGRCCRPLVPGILPDWVEDLITKAFAEGAGTRDEQIARKAIEDPELRDRLAERLWPTRKTGS